jgi:mRNA interferase HigB
MKILARGTLVEFWTKHPETKPSLSRWYQLAASATWSSANDVRQVFPKAVGLNAERLKFEVAGGNYRMIVAFNYQLQIAFVKFVGTHEEYDRIDPLTVSLY